MLHRTGNIAVVPLGIGYYTAAEAAALIGASVRSVARWLGGYAYKNAKGERVEGAPLWRPQVPDLGQGLELGFRDLIELRFVLAFVRQKVPLNVVRRCLATAREVVGEERPFATNKFKTDGRRIFLDSFRVETASEMGGNAQLIDLATRQLVFKPVVEQTFKDLDLAEGAVVRWRPHQGKPSIVIDPLRSFGKPVAAESGAPTAALALSVRAEGSVLRTSRLFGVPQSVVKDAVDFERSLMAA